MRICPRCAAHLNDGEKTCPTCGTDVLERSDLTRRGPLSPESQDDGEDVPGGPVVIGVSVPKRELEKSTEQRFGWLGFKVGCALSFVLCLGCTIRDPRNRGDVGNYICMLPFMTGFGGIFLGVLTWCLTVIGRAIGGALGFGRDPLVEVFERYDQGAENEVESLMKSADGDDPRIAPQAALGSANTGTNSQRKENIYEPDTRLPPRPTC
jgi:hypothetical protein